MMLVLLLSCHEIKFSLLIRMKMSKSLKSEACKNIRDIFLVFVQRVFLNMKLNLLFIETNKFHQQQRQQKPSFSSLSHTLMLQ